jgi:AraC-like DNA-binding protein
LRSNAQQFIENNNSPYTPNTNVGHYCPTYELSDNQEMSITAIMMEAGFSTKSNFNKEFLRVTGLNPSEYRKQQQRAFFG